jgi:hypothetical protein
MATVHAWAYAKTISKIGCYFEDIDLSKELDPLLKVSLHVLIDDLVCSFFI